MKKKVYIESYGCAMNFSDSEIVASILAKDGYAPVESAEDADLVLLNTCSIREKAEYTVLQRINEMNSIKSRNKGMKVGVLGCMAERMREDLLEKKKVVDLVVGPDAYRTLPDLLEQVGTGQKAVNVLLSREETYAEIEPVRLNSNGVTAFVTIMRGCDNMCAFCVVPFTRGRERSRDPQTIVEECRDLAAKGYREVTLLGQNVDSFKWKLTDTEAIVDFADLLEMVALACPTLRIRYSTSHPKDMTDKVLVIMAKYDNICKYIHLPVQSGSSDVLHRMNRGYTREWYKQRVASIREHMPDCAITTDMISGFCGETEEDHEQTLSLMNEIGYEMAYMFKYSSRPKTLADRKYPDDVPEEVKGRRLQEVINTQRQLSLVKMARYVGSTREVLAEGASKRSKEHLFGRISQGAVTILPRMIRAETISRIDADGAEVKGLTGMIEILAGDLVDVAITSSTSSALKGEVVTLRTARTLDQLKANRTEGIAEA